MKRTKLLFFFILTPIIAAQLTLPAHSATGCGVNCANADLQVTNFSQKSLTWSLSFSLPGDRTNKTTLADTDNLHLFRDNLLYDSATNSTTFADQEVDSWNNRAPVGNYPNQTWFVSLYFATNNTVDIQNFFNARPQILQLSTPDYSGNYSATAMQCTPLSLNQSIPQCYRDYGNGGSVRDPFAYDWPKGYYLQLRYNVTLFIWRNSGIVSQLNASLVLIPWLFWIFYGLLAALIAQGVLTLHPSTRTRALNRKVIDSAFFTTGVGFLFFLPVYSLSLAPVGSPIPNTPIQTQLSQLILLIVGVMIVGLFLDLGVGFASDVAVPPEDKHGTTEGEDIGTQGNQKVETSKFVLSSEPEDGRTDISPNKAQPTHRGLRALWNAFTIKPGFQRAMIQFVGQPEPRRDALMEEYRSLQTGIWERNNLQWQVTSIMIPLVFGTLLLTITNRNALSIDGIPFAVSVPILILPFLLLGSLNFVMTEHLNSLSWRRVNMIEKMLRIRGNRMLKAEAQRLKQEFPRIHLWRDRLLKGMYGLAIGFDLVTLAILLLLQR